MLTNNRKNKLLGHILLNCDFTELNHFDEFGIEVRDDKVLLKMYGKFGYITDEKYITLFEYSTREELNAWALNPYEQVTRIMSKIDDARYLIHLGVEKLERTLLELDYGYYNANDNFELSRLFDDMEDTELNMDVHHALYFMDLEEDPFITIEFAKDFLNHCKALARALNKQQETDND